MAWNSCVLLNMCLLAVQHAAGQETPISQKLHSSLFAGYQPDVLPIFSPGDAVNVQTKIALVQIRSVNVHDSTFSGLFYINYRWSDQRLTWDPEVFDGVDGLAVGEENIWLPDIQFWTSVSHSRVFENHVSVHSSGSCAYLASAVITVVCDYDLTWFPYDSQSCPIYHGSWLYGGSKVNLTVMLDRIDLPFYRQNAGWELQETPAQLESEEDWSYVLYTVKLKRRGGKYAFEYITPAVVLSFLIPVLFILPSQSSARFALGAGMLVSVMLMMSSLNNILPTELSSRPMLGNYYDLMFILVSVALAVSAIINYWACRPSKSSPPPEMLQKIFLNCLGRVLCVSYDRKYGTPAGNDLESEAKTDSCGSYEWRLMATVLDRLFLLIFLVTVVIGSIAALPK